MFNIRKIAEEIFQAPSRDELDLRWFDNYGGKPKNIEEFAELFKKVYWPQNVVWKALYNPKENIFILVQHFLLNIRLAKLAKELKIKIVFKTFKEMRELIEDSPQQWKAASVIKDIFKAPTIEDLLERIEFFPQSEIRKTFDNWTHWGNKNKYTTVDGLDKKLDTLAVLFPSGAYIINSDSPRMSVETFYATEEYMEVDSELESDWHLEMDGGWFEKWYSSKTKQGKNIIMVKFRGSSVTYIIEK